LSAKNGVQVDALQQTIQPFLPESPHLFGDDQFTDRSLRFLCAELLREKIFRLCGEELPYATNVEIESFKEEDKLIRIHALILVEKASHKRMLIGEKGEKLKEMATTARLDMEKLLGKKVFLQCWCKVKTGWADDERMLKQLGYDC
jgi:GTP-binding protein Era